MFQFIINLYCLLVIFLPISGLFSGFINKSIFAFWKEFLVSIIFVLLIPNLWRRRNFIPKSLQILFLSFVILTFLVIFNSIWIQNLPLKAVFLGFRFELWWLFLFIFVYFLTIIKRKELQNSSQISTETQNKLNLKTKSKKNLLNLETESNYLENSNIKQQFWHQINPKQKIHLSIYLGFFLLIGVYLTSLLIGQSELLKFFGFQNNSSQISGQLCHLVDFGQDSCRLTLGFGSPNHLAGYLLLVLPVFWSDFFGISE